MQLINRTGAPFIFDKLKLDFTTGLYYGETVERLDRIIISKLYVSTQLTFKEVIELEYLRFAEVLTPALFAFYEGISLADGTIVVEVNSKYFSLIQDIVYTITFSETIKSIDELAFRIVKFPTNNIVQLLIDCPRNCHVTYIKKIFSTIDID